MQFFKEKKIKKEEIVRKVCVTFTGLFLCLAGITMVIVDKTHFKKTTAACAGARRYAIDVKFSIDGKKYQKRIYTFFGASFSKLGDVVHVRYDPADPFRTIELDRSALTVWIEAIILFGLGFIVIFSGAFSLF